MELLLKEHNYVENIFNLREWEILENQSSEYQIEGPNLFHDRKQNLYQ